MSTVGGGGTENNPSARERAGRNSAVFVRPERLNVSSREARTIGSREALRKELSCRPFCTSRCLAEKGAFQTVSRTEKSCTSLPGARGLLGADQLLPFAFALSAPASPVAQLAGVSGAP